METINSLKGMLLVSGALCIDSMPIGETGEFIVLAFRTHPLHSYVVWNADQAGNCWRGDYCSTLDEAIAAYKRRAGL
jgi:hypothetical protein